MEDPFFEELRAQLIGLSNQYGESKKGYKNEMAYKRNLSEMEKMFQGMQGGTPSRDPRTFSDRGAGGFGGNKPADPRRASEFWSDGKDLRRLAGVLPDETLRIDDFNFLNSFRR